MIIDKTMVNPELTQICVTQPSLKIVMNKKWYVVRGEDMKYDFSKITNRYYTDSLKWNVKDNELPMWVADMDFETAPEIIEALHQRVEHGVFGYNTVSDDYFQSIQIGG